MEWILRLISAFWIWMTFNPSLSFFKKIFAHGFHFQISILSLLSLAMFVGGIALLLLREWGRWILLIGAAIYLILKVGPALIHFHLNLEIAKTLIFYAFFIVILALPQARGVTKK